MFMKWIICIFKGHEMTLESQDAVEGANLWKCKKCSFGMMAPKGKDFEDVIMKRR